MLLRYLRAEISLNLAVNVRRDMSKFIFKNVKKKNIINIIFNAPFLFLRPFLRPKYGKQVCDPQKPHAKG